jgi:hypothetical protein
MPILCCELRTLGLVAEDAEISHRMRSTEGEAMGAESRDDRGSWMWRSHRELLLGALDGIELQSAEEQLVEWLAGWDDWTVTTTAMLIGAARAAGPEVGHEW